MTPGSRIFRDIRFSKGSDTQDQLYHNENLFRRIDMMWVLFEENYFWDIYTSILIFWKKSYLGVQNPLINSLSFHKCRKNASIKIFLTQFLKLIMITYWKYLQGMSFHPVITIFIFLYLDIDFWLFKKIFNFWLLDQKSYFSTFSS